MREKLIELLKKTGVTWAPGNIADYLMKNGVIVTQCKVGDVIYYYHPEDSSEIIKVLVNEVSMTREGIRLTTFFEKAGNGRITYLYESFFGKSLYHTYEEALKAKEESKQ